MYGHRLHGEDQLNWDQGDLYINYSSDWSNIPLNKDAITDEMIESADKWLENQIGSEMMERNDEELPELAEIDITKAKGIQINVLEYIS